jgi:hypothetical protein
MEPRDRLLQRDPLRLVTVRKTLRTVADCLSNLEKDEADKYLATLSEEIEMLKRCETKSLAWRQATSAIAGSRRYGLERIGMIADNSDSA